MPQRQPTAGTPCPAEIGSSGVTGPDGSVLRQHSHAEPARPQQGEAASQQAHPPHAASETQGQDIGGRPAAATGGINPTINSSRRIRRTEDIACSHSNIREGYVTDEAYVVPGRAG